jgi:hypothetical protein
MERAGKDVRFEDYCSVNFKSVVVDSGDYFFWVSWFDSFLVYGLMLCLRLYFHTSFKILIFQNSLDGTKGIEEE